MSSAGVEENAIVRTAEHGLTVGPAPAARGLEHVEEHPEWPVLSRVPMRLAVALPLRRFRVQDLLRLAPGQTFVTARDSSSDVPVRVGNVQLGWAEFEVVEGRMAVRLNRLA